MMDIEIPLFRIRTGRSVAFRINPKALPSASPCPTTSGARSLALGHRLAKAVDQGEARDFTELALRLGVTQARVSQLVALTFLAPDIQEQILEGNPAIAHLTIHHLLLVARLPAWADQRGFWQGFRNPSESVSGREGRSLNPDGACPAPESQRKAERGHQGATRKERRLPGPSSIDPARIPHRPAPHPPTRMQ